MYKLSVLTSICMCKYLYDLVYFEYNTSSDRYYSLFVFIVYLSLIILSSWMIYFFVTESRRLKAIKSGLGPNATEVCITISAAIASGPVINYSIIAPLFNQDPNKLVLIAS